MATLLGGDLFDIGKKALAQLFLDDKVVRRKDELTLRQIAVRAHASQVDASSVVATGGAGRSLQLRAQAQCVRRLARVLARDRRGADYLKVTAHANVRVGFESVNACIAARVVVVCYIRIWQICFATISVCIRLA